MNETDIINTPWRDRGYLPHLEHQKVQVLTFRLYDSVPSRIIDEWKSQLAEESETSSKSDLIKQIKKQIDQYEDSGHGQCFLRNKDVAKVVEDTLLYGNGKIYKLISWCVMPNHVHVMIEILNDTPVSNIVKQWKSFSAHQANKILNRQGKFWMREYFDRYVRDMEHYNNAIKYIDHNPIKAGLTQFIGDWRWSSAYHMLHTDDQTD